MDRVLADRGLERRVAVTVPHFQAVALDRRRGRPARQPADPLRASGRARLLDLDLYLPPFDPPILDVMLFWHRRVDGNAANAWLRNHIKRVLDVGPVEVTDPLIL